MTGHHQKPNSDQRVVIDAARPRPLLDWREIWAYRDLFYFLIWRDLKSRYAQSILGIGWAVVQPVFSMIVFTVVFGKLAKISSDGVPYAIFSYTALVPWTYFSTALTTTGGSLVAATSMVSKVYFPRVLIPLTPIIAKLIDFAIAMLILFGLMVWYGMRPTAWAFAVPLLVLLMMLTAMGIGMWLAALAVQYRDVNYATPFGIQMLMYAAPVVYPTSAIPDEYLLLYSINPMVGVIEGFRSSLLGTIPMPWNQIGIGLLTSLLIAVGGLTYFSRTERHFSDVI